LRYDFFAGAVTGCGFVAVAGCGAGGTVFVWSWVVCLGASVMGGIFLVAARICRSRRNGGCVKNYKGII